MSAYSAHAAFSSLPIVNKFLSQARRRDLDEQGVLSVALSLHTQGFAPDVSFHSQGTWTVLTLNMGVAGGEHVCDGGGHDEAAALVP
jgi:hypothetical protein